MLPEIHVGGLRCIDCLAQASESDHSWEYPIVRFILNHYEIASAILMDNHEQIELSHEMCDIVPFLGKIFLIVRELESDCASVVRVCPVTSELTTLLEESVSGDESDSSKMTSKNGGAIVRERVLHITNSIVQLTSVLTPDGRARREKKYFFERLMIPPIQKLVQFRIGWKTTTRQIIRQCM
jgi:hypothetical protein